MLRAWKSIAVMTVMALVLSLVAVAVPLAKPVQADPGWLDTGGGLWKYKMKLTIDHTLVDATLADFPVLVYLSTQSGNNNEDVSCVFDELASDANRKKIAVTTSDGSTQCYVEIEKWDDGNEEAWLWVSVPVISSSSDTELYLYYDSSQAHNTAYVGDTTEAVAEDVWDSHFEAVWHLDNCTVTSTICDSTASGKDGTKVSGTEPILTGDGRIANAQEFDGDDDYIDLGTISSGDPLMLDGTDVTWSAWILRDSGGDQYSRILDKSSAGSATNGWAFYVDNTNKEINVSIDGTNYYGFSNEMYDTDGLWYYLTAVFDPDADELKLYSGSTLEETVTGVTENIPDSNNDAHIGTWYSEATREWDGRLDEIRVSSTARSAAWVKASYESGRDQLIEYNATGRITVYKDAHPDYNYTFGFHGDLGMFELNDDGVGGEYAAQFFNLPYGVYNITEEVPTTGWDLLLVTYSGLGASTLYWPGPPSGTATLEFDPDDGGVGVWFHNYKWGTITVCKEVVSIHTETQEFEFSSDIPEADDPFFLDDDGVDDNCVTFNASAGTSYINYLVSELVPDGWDLTDITISEGISDNSPDPDLEAAEATLRLDNDEAIVVTFENTKRGNVIVEKHTRGGAKGSFTFTGDVAGSIGGGGKLEEELVPGKYTVRERIPAGWELSSIRCDDDNSSGSVATGTATIRLEPGETVTCTYTNTYQGSIPGLPRKQPGAVGGPEPASVLACYLDVPVVEAMPGQQFDISVNLCNRGGEKATKSVDLLINGYQEQSQTVGLGPGACQTVVFRVFKTVPGTYEVSVMGQVGYFTIMPLYPGYVVTQGPPQQAGGIGTAGIVTIVVVLIVLVIGVVLILRR